MKPLNRRLDYLFILNDGRSTCPSIRRHVVTSIRCFRRYFDTMFPPILLFLQRSEGSHVNQLPFTLYWKKQPYAGNTQQAAILRNIINQFRWLFSTVCVNEPVSILRGDMKKAFLVLKFKWIFGICTLIIIIYHDFLPTPRRGSHVKSGKTHTQSSRYTP